MIVSITEEILTERCRLRYPSKDDFPHIWSATRVEGFNDGMLWDPPANISELEEPLLRSQEAWVKGESFAWSIDLRDTSEFAGRIAIRQGDDPAEWSIGFWIHPSVQKSGIATEAARAIVNFGFESLGAGLITAAHATWNKSSGRVLSKIGMTQVQLNPRGFKKRGEWVEEYEYELRG